MRARTWRASFAAWWRAGLAACAATLALQAHAGAQQYEALSAAVRATLAQAVTDGTPPDLRDMDTRVWVRAMTRRVAGRFRDEGEARQFLGLLRYEAMRA